MELLTVLFTQYFFYVICTFYHSVSYFTAQHVSLIPEKGIAGSLNLTWSLKKLGFASVSNLFMMFRLTLKFGLHHVLKTDQRRKSWIFCNVTSLLSKNANWSQCIKNKTFKRWHFWPYHTFVKQIHFKIIKNFSKRTLTSEATSIHFSH